MSGDTNNTSDVFVKDLLTGITTRISTDTDGVQGNNYSYFPSLRADGSKVSFLSQSTNLISSDSNSANDVFVKDLSTGVLTHASINESGVQADSASFEPALSADGTRVAFHTSASNLVSGDTNSRVDVFVKDLSTGVVVRVSSDSMGAQGDGVSQQAALSADGTIVTFSSVAGNLVSGDLNGAFDVFVKDLSTDVIQTTSLAVIPHLAGNNSLMQPVFSQDGTKVAFYSHASNLVGSDLNGYSDIFIKDLASGEVTLVSTAVDSTQANRGSFRPIFSPDSTSIMFASDANNLVDGDSTDKATFSLRTWQQARLRSLAPQRPVSRGKMLLLQACLAVTEPKSPFIVMQATLSLATQTEEATFL